MRQLLFMRSLPIFGRLFQRYDYGFLVRTDNGYSYQFQYALPYDRIQNEIPEDAISILSTMVIHEPPIPDQLGMENRHAH